MIKIAICDDDKVFLQQMKTQVNSAFNKLGKSIEVYTYESGNRVLGQIISGKEKFHILFLDIDMPGTTGLEVAKSIRDNSIDIILIFVSSYEKYVFDSIEYSPFRYVRKSRLEEEIPVVIKAAYEFISRDTEDKTIVLKSEDEQIRVNNMDIMYFQTELRKLAVYLKNGEKISVRKTVKELLEELKDENIIQIHSGGAANVKYICKFSNTDITLDNGNKLTVSRGRMRDVKSSLFNYWGNKV